MMNYVYNYFEFDSVGKKSEMSQLSSWVTIIDFFSLFCFCESEQLDLYWDIEAQGFASRMCWIEESSEVRGIDSNVGDGDR